MTGTPPTRAEQHLGDRLAALVDGELRDDARERVLAHLATCEQCKTAADEQRRLKSAIAAAAPPAVSAALLARLQGLPAGAGTDEGGPFGGGFAGGGRAGLSFLSSAPDSADPAKNRPSGFRIHEIERSAGSRGRRFAFAAAGAFSMAALALGGALPLDTTVDGGQGDETGSAITPLTADTRPRSDGLLRAPGAVITPVAWTYSLVLPAARPLPAPSVTDIPSAAPTPMAPVHQVPGRFLP